MDIAGNMFLEQAIQIAAQAHSGQRDKGGSPYILHPLRVMLHMESEDERIVAVLHDVVEDSWFTLEMLAAKGFSATILDALRALTKQPGETRIAAAERAAKNRLACRVKLADNADNMDMSRIPKPTDKDLARLEEYKAVRAILEATY